MSAEVTSCWGAAGRAVGEGKDAKLAYGRKDGAAWDLSWTFLGQAWGQWAWRMLSPGLSGPIGRCGKQGAAAETPFPGSQVRLKHRGFNQLLGYGPVHRGSQITGSFALAWREGT